MWICLSNAFLSIVSKDCQPDELLVRARRKGDIERVFPDAIVTRYTKSDYLFRAVVKRADIAHAMAQQVAAIEYPNFKDSVENGPLRQAYGKVWSAMAEVQPLRPYSGLR